MVSKVVKFYISLASLIGLTLGGELYVLHCPSSLKLSESEIEESALEELYAAMLGGNVEKGSLGYGLHVLDPFGHAEAVVEVYVEGAASLGPAMERRAQRISLQGDEEMSDDPSRGIAYRIKQHPRRGDIVHIKLSDPETPDYLFRSHELLGEVPIAHDPARRQLRHLQLSAEPDRSFLSELDALRSVTAKVSGGAVRADGRPDVFKLSFGALHALADTRGPNSEPTREALALLVESLLELKESFSVAYSGGVVVAARAGDAAAAHWRLDLRAADDASALAKHRALEQRRYDRLAMVHIVAWVCAALAGAASAAVLVFMAMDPGRDTLIYRKTHVRACTGQ